MKRVAVVDYGVSNLDSVARALEECGATPFVTADPAELRHASLMVLPGVGAFDLAPCGDPAQAAAIAALTLA